MEAILNLTSEAFDSDVKILLFVHVENFKQFTKTLLDSPAKRLNEEKDTKSSD